MTMKLLMRSPEWVACMDRLRPAHDGSVACPISGTAVDLETCATCHRLEDADQDRSPSWSCDAVDASTTPIPIGSSVAPH